MGLEGRLLRIYRRFDADYLPGTNHQTRSAGLSARRVFPCHHDSCDMRLALRPRAKTHLLQRSDLLVAGPGYAVSQRPALLAGGTICRIGQWERSALHRHLRRCATLHRLFHSLLRSCRTHSERVSTAVPLSDRPYARDPPESSDFLVAKRVGGSFRGDVDCKFARWTSLPPLAVDKGSPDSHHFAAPSHQERNPNCDSDAFVRASRSELPYGQSPSPRGDRVLRPGPRPSCRSLVVLATTGTEHGHRVCVSGGCQSTRLIRCRIRAGRNYWNAIPAPACSTRELG